MQIPGYQIKETIFKGRSSSIVRALREHDKETVILRMMDTDYPPPIEIARFKREYELLKDLNIKGVIKFYSYEEIKNSPLIVMEDFGGQPLNQVMSENKVKTETKIKIAANIAGILGDIHKAGIIHKDINPNNILMNPKDGTIKIIDFEISTILSYENQQLQNPDKLEGTLGYISPEQTGRMNRPIDYRSDIYSLGITFYEMFCGERPFTAKDSIELVHLHMAKIPETLTQKNPEIPAAISDIVGKMMEKNAEDRYKSSHAVKSDLQKVLSALAESTSLDGFIAGENDFSERFQIPAKLYGRENEITTLLEAYERVCEGNIEIMLVYGYSGVGKSALINEVHKPITEHRGYFISGKFDQYKRNIPYSSLISAFQDLIRQLLTESDEQVAVWKNKLLTSLESSAQVIIDVIPELEHIIGPQREVAALGPLEAQNRFNLYFRNFVQVFTRKEHPLSLFLDDLQWADAASLTLIESLSTDSSGKYFFIIGAYRDNEVDGSHPLMLMLDRAKKEKVAIQKIALKPLNEEVLSQIVAETFSCTNDKAQPLTEIVHKKTNGNPFFINQLLKDLYESKLATYDLDKHQWKWDLQKIGEMKMSDNVINLMVKKIQKLPENTQKQMQLAACIGNQFKLSDLAHVCRESEDELAQSLEEALWEELILPIGDSYKFASSMVGGSKKKSSSFIIEYKFLHDRVQQAAYDMLGSIEKSEAHFKIGNLLLENTPQTQLSDHIFDIVNQFNQALELVQEPEKRTLLADLNLQAGRKAKNSIAYEPALKYIITAQEIMDDTLKKENPRLWFQLVVERAETEHLCGNSENAEKHFSEALKITTSRDEKAGVYEKIIHFYTNIGNFKSAYQAGRKAVKLFGVSLPAGFIPPLFAIDLLKAKIKLSGRKVEQLLDLAICKDEEKRTAMRLIAAILKATYQIRPELCIHNAIKAVNLSLKYGNIEDNAVSYVVFGGIFLGGVLGNRQTGYEFGKLALAMNDKFDNLSQRSEVNFVSAYFTNFWMRPAIETEKYYKAAYENGLQTGDFFHVSCAACTLVMSQFIRGVNLDEVKRIGTDYHNFMNRIDSREAKGAIQATLSAIDNLKGNTNSPISFSSGDIKEDEYIDEIKKFISLHFTHFYYVNKMLSLFLWGKYTEALETATESEKYLKYSIAMLHTVEHHFLHALILSALYTQTGKKKHLNKIKKIHKKIGKWAKANRDNFEHQDLIIQAELSKHNGGGWKTVELYEKAAKSANENGFIQKAAIANELAGRYMISQKMRKGAKGYLSDAYHAYMNWGASAVANKLAKEFPWATENASHGKGLNHLSTTVMDDATTVTASYSSGTSDSTSKSILDIDTVVKSTQAISGEIKLSSLLEKLMEIIIENAGAEKGYFIVHEKQKYLIEAEGSVNSKEVKTLQSLPIEEGNKVAASVIQYVARTSEPVLLANAATNRQFGNDPSIKENQTKSLLCSPIIHQGKTVGIIYLENNLATGTFTEKRLDMLKMISAQAAISLENARHYDNLEHKVEERTRDLAKEREKSDKLLENILPREIAIELKYNGKVEPQLYRSATIMFTDFKGFTQKAGMLSPEELLHELDTRFTRFDEICDEHGLEKLKTIGDAYMCAGGLPNVNYTHIVDMCLGAMQIQDYMFSKAQNVDDFDVWELRIGIHTGPVMAGVIGQNKFTYDVWGDTVNVSARLESSGEPGKINISADVYELVKKYFECTDRGEIEARGKGKIKMFFLNRLKPEYATDEKGLVANEILRDEFEKEFKAHLKSKK
ncbi:MAG: adenylate/guanylate cyclase domain-containing protein [Leptospirales bacterium]